MDRVLVTGCSGFVGGVLVGALGRDGFEVWGVDRGEDSGYVQADRYQRLDLTDRAAVGAALDVARPRYIVHLAAQSSAGRSFDEPHFTLWNNIVPVLHLLDYVRTRNQPMRLLAVGSADVYGPVGHEELPLRETRRPNPQNPYALSKAIQEQCCDRYAALFDTDVVSTRSFNHTGPGQRDTFVLPSFARQLAEIEQGLRKPVVEVGNLELRRDFTDVRDVCAAYSALLSKGRPGQVYNVCSGRSYRLLELLDRMIAISGIDAEVRVAPDRVRPVDMEELRGDPTKVIADTGWSPQYGIDETLGALIDDWRVKLKTGQMKGKKEQER